ncbi:MAG: ABC transporter substrate-binding protein [Formosimonas sp.]
MRKMSLTAGALAVVALMSACGDKKPADGAAKPADKSSAGQTTLTVATVNNGDMVVMQELSKKFEAANPDIKLNWVVLEENALRQKVTTDVAAKGGQFDIITVGMYDTPIFAKKGFLAEIKDLPENYDVNDLIPAVKEGLSADGKLYALPFYGETSMTFYRKDLFAEKKLQMPAKPTYADIEKFAAALTDKSKEQYGICLRGKAGWGENMAFLSTMVNANGGRWFDEKWTPELTSPEWKATVAQYVNLLTQYGPPGASSNGFNENLALMAGGKCGMWIDASVAAGMLYNPKESKIADKVAFAPSPVGAYGDASGWLWSWNLAIPASSGKQAAAKKFVTWATSKEYLAEVATTKGWGSVPPGTRKSTYANAEYQKAAPFAGFVLDALSKVNPAKATAKPVPYVGVQYVGIPEFQALGTVVGQSISGALAGKSTVDQALEASQAAARKAIEQGGYVK